MCLREATKLFQGCCIRGVSRKIESVPRDLEGGLTVPLMVSERS